MRIVHVIETVDPQKGGTSAVPLRLAAAQAALGYEVFVGARDLHGYGESMAESIAAVPQASLIKFVSLPAGLRIGEAGRALKRILERGDILHLHGVWEPLLWLAAHTAKKNRANYVLTPHGMLDAWCLAHKRWKKKLALMAWVERMLSNSLFIHVLNDHETQQLGNLGFGCRLATIPNGVFFEEICYEEEDRRGLAWSFPSLGSRPYILFLGRLNFKKGLDYLAAAFRRFAGRDDTTDLVIVGPDDGAKEAFVRQIAEYRLLNRVHILGPVNGIAKYALIKNATCFCLPSRQEGFSLAILEAMASGVPVVVTENCNFPEISKIGAGKVVKLDAEVLCEALWEYVGSRELAREAGNAGRKLVMSKYTWSMVASQMVSAYRRALHEEAVTGPAAV